MPARPLALAALLLLTPAPAAAQAVTETAPPPAAEAPAEVPDGGGVPSSGDPDGPAPAPGSEAPVSDAPDDDAPSSQGEAPGPGSEPRTVSPAADAPDAPAPSGPRERAEQTVDATAATGTGRVPPAEEPTPAAGARGGPAAGTGPVEGPRDGTRAQHGRPPEGGALPGREQVTPGTVNRIPLGALTRVPAQGSAEEPGSGLPPAAWGLGLSAMGAVAAGALVARRVRAGRDGG